MTRRALISVSDKTNLLPLAKGLIELGFEILSTGGTYRTLLEAGITVIEVSAYTGFPEVMDGRLKTLHPRIHGGLLGRPDLPHDAQAMQEHGITPFELVVVNLYPFVRTISKPGVTTSEAIEQIDIGGPSMVRSAAKNHKYVGVVTSPAQYDDVLKQLRHGPLSIELRRQLAAEAFEMTARYDRAIADYLTSVADPSMASSPEFPTKLQLSYERRSLLRYGENPHQRGAFYVEREPHAATLAAAEVIHGKELSYNNLLDLDAAMQIVREFDKPAACVIKHNNPCGCAGRERFATCLRGG